MRTGLCPHRLLPRPHPDVTLRPHRLFLGTWETCWALPALSHCCLPVPVPLTCSFILILVAMPHSLRDLSSLTRDGTQAHSSYSAKSSPLDRQGIPLTCGFKTTLAIPDHVKSLLFCINILNSLARVTEALLDPDGQMGSFTAQTLLSRNKGHHSPCSQCH